MMILGLVKVLVSLLDILLAAALFSLAGAAYLGYYTPSPAMISGSILATLATVVLSSSTRAAHVPLGLPGTKGPPIEGFSAKREG